MKTQQQQLRIIGGQYRSRKLSFPDIEGLRPTLDRVRETVFNWLQFEIEGKRVLDCFAGSGAMGLEALSRGAASVVFVEKHPQAAKQLQDNLRLLQAANAQVITGDALTWLSQHPSHFDVIFLDPPFGQGLLQDALDQLTLASGTLLYLEHETGLVLNLPSQVQELKCKTTKEFCFRLFQVA